MTRYIDADALLEEQGNLVCAGLRNGKTILLACKNYLKAVIDHAPTADVAPVVHGKWIETGYYSCFKNPIYLCSACHKEVEDRYIKNHEFCLHCGAKMDLED